MCRVLAAHKLATANLPVLYAAIAQSVAACEYSLIPVAILVAGFLMFCTHWFSNMVYICINIISLLLPVCVQVKHKINNALCRLFIKNTFTPAQPV